MKKICIFFGLFLAISIQQAEAVSSGSCALVPSDEIKYYIDSTNPCKFYQCSNQQGYPMCCAAGSETNLIQHSDASMSPCATHNDIPPNRPVPKCGGTPSGNPPCNYTGGSVTVTWTEWVNGQCSVTCGTGTQTRTRTSNTGVTERETISCSAGLCYYATGIQPCSVTCGAGTRTVISTSATTCPPSTTCFGTPLPVSVTCNGNAGDCPVYKWFGTQCVCPSGGSQALYNNRICVDTTISNTVPDANCISAGLGAANAACNTATCFTLTQWSQWSACSQTCDPGNGTTGVRSRTRQCVSTQGSTPASASSCAAPLTETQSCTSVRPCCVFSPFYSDSDPNKQSVNGDFEVERSCGSFNVDNQTFYEDRTVTRGMECRRQSDNRLWNTIIPPIPGWHISVGCTQNAGEYAFICRSLKTQMEEVLCDNYIVRLMCCFN